MGTFSRFRPFATENATQFIHHKPAIGVPFLKPQRRIFLQWLKTCNRMMQGRIDFLKNRSIKKANHHRNQCNFILYF